MDPKTNDDPMVTKDNAEAIEDELDDVNGGAGYAFVTNCLNCGEPLPRDRNIRKCPKCGYEIRKF